MALESRIRELDTRHRTLDAEIAQQSRLPAANEAEIKILKLRKLRLKEEIERLRASG